MSSLLASVGFNDGFVTKKQPQIPNGMDTGLDVTAYTAVIASYLIHMIY